jgi:hypothetical protein
LPLAACLRQLAACLRPLIHDQDFDLFVVISTSPLKRA